jgi:hypothetical protein
MHMRPISGLLLVAALCAGFRANVGAQTAAPVPTPSPIVVPTLPPANATTQAIIRAASALVDDIITRNRLNAANTTHGTVSYFRHFDLQVQTGANSYRDVHLHPGTVINPRGATPASGTVVDVDGRGAPDGSLDADTITVRH